MDINLLRRLIRTGEFLEENFSDDRVRSQWIFDVESFVDTLDTKKRNQIQPQIFHMKNSGSTIHEQHKRSKGHFILIMGFLRSLYNEGNPEQKPIAVDSQSVFIIHGHDDTLIEEVKKCIADLKLSPIVLREQPNNGKTIIEKLEDWLGNTKCAVVLYTPCDKGYSVNNLEDIEYRARQNVVYEHGLFQGYLGRKRIIVLKKGNTAMPGDCSGVVYISAENANWGTELKENILAIDRYN